MSIIKNRKFSVYKFFFRLSHAIIITYFIPRITHFTFASISVSLWPSGLPACRQAGQRWQSQAKGMVFLKKKLPLA